jgi:hypothetical protein
VYTLRSRVALTLALFTAVGTAAGYVANDWPWGIAVVVAAPLVAYILGRAAARMFTSPRE